MKRKIAITIVLVGLIFSSCTPTNQECGNKNQDYIARVESLVAQWDSNSEKIGKLRSSDFLLSPLVPNQGKIRESLDGIKPPRCAKEAHEELHTSMLYEMEGYFSIIAKSSNLGDGTIDDQYIDDVFRQANEHRIKFDQLWDIIAP